MHVNRQVRRGTFSTILAPLKVATASNGSVLVRARSQNNYDMYYRLMHAFSFIWSLFMIHLTERVV
jgi:hypothetical protein